MIRIRVFPYQALPSREELTAFLGERVAGTLGSGRRGNALQETLLGFCLLAQLLPDVPLDAVQKTANGRPFLAGYPELDFSITHCNGLVGCALELADNPQIGLDAEGFGGQTPLSMQRVANRWFTAKERETFAVDPTEQTFLSLWTAKEAFSKWQGSGLRSLLEPDREEIQVKTYQVGTVLLSAVCRRGRELPKELEIADSLFPR